MKNFNSSFLRKTLAGVPDAFAEISGSRAHPHLKGKIYFYKTPCGVIVYSEVSGLPNNNPCGVFGFHIHEGAVCSGNTDDPFADTLGHYNPRGTKHPYHAGDMPPLFSNNGCALSLFMTDRFTLNEVIGRTVIVHSMPDDFTTQPSGNSGEKIACGKIKRFCH